MDAMRLDDISIAKVVVTLGAAERPVTLDKVRLDRQMRELAIDHVEGRVSDEVSMERLKDLRGRLAAFDEPGVGDVPAKRAVEWLRGPTGSTPATSASSWRAGSS